MNNELINIGAHGLGDCILSLQISQVLKNQGIVHKNIIASRNDVYLPIKHIFKEFQIEQENPELAENNSILKEKHWLAYTKAKYNSENITYNVPSLLFQNPLAFDFQKYNTSPFFIKRLRLLTNQYQNKENIIYCALTSSTNGYIRQDLKEIIINLAQKLPHYQIYFPYVTQWDRNINYPFQPDDFFPPNVVIDYNPEFQKSLDVLVKSSYCVSVCNGPSHIAYHLGIPRLLIDPQFGRVAHMVRWKEDFEECIPFMTNPSDISDIVYHNIVTPYTASMDRKVTLQFIQKGQTNWNQIFDVKY